MLNPYIVIGALTDPVATGVTWTDLAGVWASLTAQITVANILGVVAGVLAGTVGIAFAWWGAKYATRKIRAAMKNGKISA